MCVYIRICMYVCINSLGSLVICLIVKKYFKRVVFIHNCLSLLCSGTLFVRKKKNVRITNVKKKSAVSLPIVIIPTSMSIIIIIILRDYIIFFYEILLFVFVYIYIYEYRL